MWVCVCVCLCVCVCAFVVECLCAHMSVMNSRTVTFSHFRLLWVKCCHRSGFHMFDVFSGSSQTFGACQPAGSIASVRDGWRTNAAHSARRDAFLRLWSPEYTHLHVHPPACSFTGRPQGFHTIFGLIPQPNRPPSPPHKKKDLK